MAKFNEYPSKATPEDNDTLMLYDAATKSNKLSPFSGIWNWIVGKLTNAVISNLQTNNKSVVGALNELYSNPAFGEHIALGGSKNAIKITPSVSYQIFFVYGYLSDPWMGVIVSEDKVIGFKFEKVGSEPVSIEKSGEDSLILKYSNVWGQAVISSKYAFNYELIQL